LATLLLVVAPSTLSGQEGGGGAPVDGGLGVETRTEQSGDTSFRLDRGPLDNLGWGTEEDLRVDLGAGAAVSVFSGNLVVRVHTFVRGDSVPDTQLALTYNHLDAEGSSGLAPGWRHDLDRRLVPGAWGGHVLVDGDGFRDSFLPGEPPESAAVLRVLDDVLVAWRRSTSIAARREAGGINAMYGALVADPLFLGEMRLKLLGPPEGGDEGSTLRSHRRGNRSLRRVPETGESVLQRSDGGTERYDAEGRLVQVEPRGGPGVRVVREAGRLVGLEVGGQEVFQVVPDASGRMRQVRSSLGYTADFDYVDRLLYRLRLPSGSVTFQYDSMGRLVGVEGPLGSLTVGYDIASGRVAWAKGPLAELELSDLEQEAGGLRVQVTGLSGGRRECTWLPEQRTRTVRRDSELRRVRFDSTRPLPVEVSGPDGTLRFAWDDAGRLLRASRDGFEVTWERDGDGVLTGLVDAAGARARMVRAEGSSLLGWSDPAGRRTSLELDEGGLPKILVRPGGLSERIHRTLQRRIRSLDLGGSPAVTLRRDSRGFPRAILGAAGSTAVLRFDAQGRLSRLTSSTGPELSISYTRHGGVASFEDGRSAPRLLYGQASRLVGWKRDGESVRLLRDDDSLILGVEQNGAIDWKLKRESSGRASVLERSGWRSQSFEFENDATPRSWDGVLGGRSSLRRDASGVVIGWVEGTGAEVRRLVNGRGQAVAFDRGSGNWRIERDPSGRPIRLVDPMGSDFSMALDAAGRVERIRAPEGLMSVFRRDDRGRLSLLRQGGVAWSLRRDGSGRPASFIDPEGSEVTLGWDRSGRWISLQRPGRDELRASYGSFGPARVGPIRRFYGPRGGLVGWGPVGGAWRWDYGRNDSERIVDVARRTPRGGSKARRLETAPVRRAIDRGPGGLPLRIGRHRLTWRDGLLEQTRSADSFAAAVDPLLRRDALGRVVALSTRGGASAEVERDDSGDVRRLVVRAPDAEAVGWTFRRDAAARVVLVERDDGLEWRIHRDALGRVTRWEIRGDPDGGFKVLLQPLDGTGLASDQALAQALDVVVTGDQPDGDLPSGSRRFEAQLHGGAEVLSFDEMRSETGALARIDGVLEATLGEWLLPPEPDQDLIGDLIPEPAVPSVQHGSAWPPLSWGGQALLGVGGMAFLPSPLSRGVGAADGWFRVATGDNATVSWLGPGADLQALRFPLSSGAWLSPEGWPALMEWDPTRRPKVRSGGADEPTAPPGLAGATADWWLGLGGNPGGLARLPLGVAASPRAWERPRQRLLAEDALLSGSEAEAGPGALLPRVPGAERLLPQPRDVRTISPLEALVLSGDLPMQSGEHRDWLALAPLPWMVAVPGAGWLRHLAQRRAWPAVPGSSTRSLVVGASDRLDGVVTRRGVHAQWTQPYELRPAAEGLPAGTRDILPGLVGPGSGGGSSLPSDARNTSLEALSADPHGTTSAWQDLVQSDATLLFLQGLAASDRSDRFASLGHEGDGESWAVDTPSGVRVVVDGRGRLLSVDALGRLHESWGRLASQLAGRSLVHPGIERLPGEALLEAPGFLPGPGPLPEIRWGLTPEDPRLPLDSQGGIPWIRDAVSAQPGL